MTFQSFLKFFIQNRNGFLKKLKIQKIPQDITFKIFENLARNSGILAKATFNFSPKISLIKKEIQKNFFFKFKPLKFQHSLINPLNPDFLSVNQKI